MLTRINTSTKRISVLSRLPIPPFSLPFSRSLPPLLPPISRLPRPCSKYPLRPLVCSELPAVTRRLACRFPRASPCAKHDHDSHALVPQSPAGEKERALNHSPNLPASSIVDTNRRTDLPHPGAS